MKLISNINKGLLIITIALDFTILLGLYAQILLGLTQLCIALYVSFNYKKLEKKLKYQILNYWIYIILYLVLLLFIFKVEQVIFESQFLIIVIIMIVPMIIAIYFTVTLNKIVKQNEK